MINELREDYEGKTLEQLQEAAQAKITTFSYVRPDADFQGKGVVGLGRGEIVSGKLQIVKKNGGENNLHYHTNVETFWWVVKGRVKFYGPGDVLIKELGANEGIITPRYCQYWFEASSDEDLELLQIAASDRAGNVSGRTNASAPPRIAATHLGTASR